MYAYTWNLKISLYVNPHQNGRRMPMHDNERFGLSAFWVHHQRLQHCVLTMSCPWKRELRHRSTKWQQEIKQHKPTITVTTTPRRNTSTSRVPVHMYVVPTRRTQYLVLIIYICMYTCTCIHTCQGVICVVCTGR